MGWMEGGMMAWDGWMEGRWMRWMDKIGWHGMDGWMGGLDWGGGAGMDGWHGKAQDRLGGWTGRRDVWMVGRGMDGRIVGGGMDDGMDRYDGLSG